MLFPVDHKPFHLEAARFPGQEFRTLQIGIGSLGIELPDLGDDLHEHVRNILGINR
jgi:hypothetical protein